MQNISFGDNLHKMSNPIFWKKESSAELFSQYAKLKFAHAGSPFLASYINL